MISLSQLVSAIHVSVQRATDALSQANYESFGRYFVNTNEQADAKAILEGALRDATTLSDTGASAEVMKRLAESLQAASAALNATTAALQPKLVAIDYPMVTKDGPVVHTVHVPLITLAPFVGIKLSKLTFKASLDVAESGDGSLEVAFASSRTPPPPTSDQGGSDQGGGAAAGKTSNTSIEIVIENALAPDGLRKVIEGYERALRAQIPG